MTFVGKPGTNASGVMTAFDIYYDRAAAHLEGGSDFSFSDPANSFWRARIDSVELGSFVITRPLVLRTGTSALQISFKDFRPGVSELLDFDAIFLERIAGGQPPLLPGPLLPDRLTTLTPDPDYLPPFWHLEGRTTFFDVPDLGHAAGYGTFGVSQVEVLGRISPVPEPSTFAAAAGTLLGALVMGRIVSRRRTTRAG